jgi:hypothetical protein
MDHDNWPEGMAACILALVGIRLLLAALVDGVARRRRGRAGRPADTDQESFML